MYMSHCGVIVTVFLCLYCYLMQSMKENHVIVLNHVIVMHTATPSGSSILCVLSSMSLCDKRFDYVGRDTRSHWLSYTAMLYFSCQLGKKHHPAMLLLVSKELIVFLKPFADVMAYCCWSQLHIMVLVFSIQLNTGNFPTLSSVHFSRVHNWVDIYFYCPLWFRDCWNKAGHLTDFIELTSVASIV